MSVISLIAVRQWLDDSDLKEYKNVIHGLIIPLLEQFGEEFTSYSNTWMRLHHILRDNELFSISSQFNSKSCPSKQIITIFWDEVDKINNLRTKNDTQRIL